MNYLFPIEITKRELDSRILLTARLLQKNGNKVFIYYYKNFDKFKKKIIKQKNILLENSPSFATTYKLLELKSNNINLVILDEEGAIITRHSSNHSPTGFDNKKLSFYKYIFTWGEEQKKKIIHDNKNITLNNIVVSGNPRMELSKNKYSEYFKEIKKYSGKKVIIINFAFGTSNSYIPYNQLKLYWKYNHSSYGDFSARNDPIFKYQNETFLPFIKGIEEIAKYFNNEIFLLRIHPVEKISTYKKIFSKFKNIIFDTQSSVQQWLPYAKLVIHNGCTTGIESYIAEKKVICYLPRIEKEEKFSQYLTLLVGKRVFTSDKLKNIIKDGLKNKFKNIPDINTAYKVNKLLSKNIRDIIKSNDSSEIISNKLNSLNIERSNFVFLFFFNFFLNTKVFKIFINLKIFLSKKNKDNTFLDKASMQMTKLNKLKYQKITSINLKKRLKLMSKIINDKNDFDYKVEEINEQVFEISKN
jgi:surface carbohydrate biosynthesis protein